MSTQVAVLKSRVSRARTHWDKTLGELREVQTRVEQAKRAFEEAQALLNHALEGGGEDGK